jgi:NADPH2:quinone reductase
MMAKIVQFNETGGPGVLEFFDAEMPAPGALEVQIRVKAIGLNRAEIMYRSGQYVIDPVFPARLGYEAAGEVMAVGESATGFRIGDRVSVIPAFSFADYGMYGEIVNAPAHAVVHIPDGISYEDAAATWMKFTTAYGALVNLGGLREGETVIIGAATSSLGLAAIQIANMVKALPVALTRTIDKVARLQEAGAAHVFLSDDPEITQHILRVTDGKGARMVFDPVGGPQARNLIRAMAFDGIYYQYGALDQRDIPVPVMDILSRHISIRGYELFEITTVPERLEAAKTFISKGLSSKALRPVIDRSFPFEDIAGAHRYMEAGNQVGKIIVTV